MTMAHEFGHVILQHKGHARPRRLNEAPRHKAFKAYEDAEHQAKVFAAAFLIPRSLVPPGMSAKEMQMRFGVSGEAAQIRHQQIFGTSGRQAPTDVKKAIEAMRRNKLTPQPRGGTAADRQARIQAEIDRKWESLERIPGEDPSAFRKARGFAVRRSDYLNRRSDYGWCLSHDEIRAYRDLESQ
jgi:Zn-dependent peptidase ImmA (M78 family)